MTISRDKCRDFKKLWKVCKESTSQTIVFTLCLKFADKKKGHEMTATTNFSYLHSADKNRCTRTNLAVNIQHMLCQNSHRHPKRKTFTSSCPLKHNANGQGWVEHIQTLFSSALSLFSPDLVFSCRKIKL